MADEREKRAGACVEKGRNPRTGQFVAGVKPGPGRPKGSKNVKPKERVERENTINWRQEIVKAAREAINPQAVKEIFAALIIKAKEGDVQAAKTALSYAMPAGATIDLSDLTDKPIRDIKTAREVVELILRAAASGTISTQEAAQMSAVIDTLSRTIDTEQMVEDLQVLKKAAEPKMLGGRQSEPESEGNPKSAVG